MSKIQNWSKILSDIRNIVSLPILTYVSLDPKIRYEVRISSFVYSSCLALFISLMAEQIPEKRVSGTCKIMENWNNNILFLVLSLLLYPKVGYRVPHFATSTSHHMKEDIWKLKADPCSRRRHGNINICIDFCSTSVSSIHAWAKVQKKVHSILRKS